MPKYPERICWGCDKYCVADDLQCGNGSERIQHPVELDGEKWYEHGDWSNLLTSEQLEEIDKQSKPSKPHIKLVRS